jgi:hypothetical protein
MAAARAAALGVRWLQRTTRGVVPLEARRGLHGVGSGCLKFTASGWRHPWDGGGGVLAGGKGWEVAVDSCAQRRDTGLL